MSKKTNKHSIPSTAAELRSVDKFFIHQTMFDLGIIPMEDASLDMRRPLNALPPEEARIAKRKFRKLWRKCMRRGYNTSSIGAARSAVEKKKANVYFGVGNKAVSKHASRRRKQLVFDFVWKEYIVSALENFENQNPEQNKTEPEDYDDGVS